jgi:hypothetical protein
MSTPPEVMIASASGLGSVAQAVILEKGAGGPAAVPRYGIAPFVSGAIRSADKDGVSSFCWYRSSRAFLKSLFCYFQKSRRRRASSFLSSSQASGRWKAYTLAIKIPHMRTGRQHKRSGDADNA